MTAIALRDVVAGYEPGLPIVRGVSLEVAAGEMVALLGPNGAGKSTLIKAIAGLVPIASGSVSLRGADITHGAAHAMVRRGLAFVPQTENVFRHLSVRENLLVAAQVLTRAHRAARVADMLALFPGLARRLGNPAGSLSGGERQMLAVARALMVRPAAIMLDEPSAGLSPRLVEEVMLTLADIRRQGVAILLVEQNVRAALDVADRALVLAEGVGVHLGPAAALRDGGLLAGLFMGRAA